MRTTPGRSRLLLLLLLLWAGVVLVSYQRVEAPEPLAAVLLALAWLAVFTLACLGGGAPLLELLAGEGAWTVERIVLALASGAGVLMALAGVLGAVGLLRPVVLGAILGVLAVAGVRPALALRRLPTPRLSRQLRLPALVVGLAAVLTLLPTLTESPFYDQLHYHLAFPFHWLRTGFIHVMPRHSYSYFPSNMGLLYGYALGTLGVWAAQALHWWMGALATLGVGTLAARLGGPRAGLWAAAVFAATPSVLQVSTWAAADLGTAALAAAAWVALLDGVLRDEPRPAWWALCGALVGLGCGCKLLGLATLAAPVGIALLTLRRTWTWRCVARRLVPFAATATLVLAPWALRNFQLTGNPTYPYLHGLFASGPAAAEADGVAQAIARLGTPLAEPARVATLSTFAPEGEGGAIGPLFLALLPLALVALGSSRLRAGVPLLLGVAVGVAGWAVGPPVGRYLLPVLVPLAALEAAGLCRGSRAWLHRRARPWLEAAVALVLAWNLAAGTTPNELRRLACTLGRDSGEELMRRYASYWPAIAFTNRELPRSARLLLVGECRSLHLDRDVVVEDPFRTPTLVELARGCSTPGEIAARLRQEGISHLLLNSHEANRLAALNGRSEYLAPLQPPERARLQLFLQGLRRLHAEWPVEVLALPATATDAP